MGNDRTHIVAVKDLEIDTSVPSPFELWKLLEKAGRTDPMWIHS